MNYRISTGLKVFIFDAVQFVQAEPDTRMANMIGQHNIRRDATGKPPIRYDAVLSGLEKVGQFALKNNTSVRIPRIGCGLAGGSWDKIEPLIEAAIKNSGMAVTVYDF